MYPSTAQAWCTVLPQIETWASIFFVTYFTWPLFGDQLLFFCSVCMLHILRVPWWTSLALHTTLSELSQQWHSNIFILHSSQLKAQMKCWKIVTLTSWWLTHCGICTHFQLSERSWKWCSTWPLFEAWLLLAGWLSLPPSFKRGWLLLEKGFYSTKYSIWRECMENYWVIVEQDLSWWQFSKSCVSIKNPVWSNIVE